MSGLVFLVAVAMIAAVVVWSIMNDGLPPSGKTRWLFAMADEDENDPGKGDDSRKGEEPGPDRADRLAR